MKFTAAQIAGILEGEVEGDPEVEVSKLSKIEEGIPESLSFLSNPKYTQYIVIEFRCLTQAIVFAKRMPFSRESKTARTNEGC